MNLIPSPLFPVNVSVYCKHRQSAGTGGAVFHWSSSVVHIAIYCTDTHDHFSNPFHTIRLTQFPSIYLRSCYCLHLELIDFSQFLLRLVMDVLVTCTLCTPSLGVKIFLSWLMSIQPTSSTQSRSGRCWVSKLWAVSVTLYGPLDRASSLMPGDCYINDWRVTANPPI